MNMITYPKLNHVSKKGPRGLSCLQIFLSITAVFWCHEQIINLWYFVFLFHLSVSRVRLYVWGFAELILAILGSYGVIDIDRHWKKQLFEIWIKLRSASMQESVCRIIGSKVATILFKMCYLGSIHSKRVAISSCSCHISAMQCCPVDCRKKATPKYHTACELQT